MSNNKTSKFLKIFAFLMAYGYTRRISGGGWPKIPRPFSQLLQSAPQTALAFFVGKYFAEANEYTHSLYVGIACAVVTFIPLFWSKITGMGQYIGIGNYPIQYSTAEKIDVLIRPFFGNDPRIVSSEGVAFIFNGIPQLKENLAQDIQAYGVKKLAWRNITGFNVLGLISGIGFFFTLLFVGMPVLAVISLLLAGSQGFVYALCWKYISYHPTAYAEFLTNVVLGTGVALVYIAVEGSIF